MKQNLDLKFSILLLFQISHLSSISASLKIIPEKCQGKPTNIKPILAEEANCKEHAPADASTVCIELCVLHNRAFIGDTGISDPGLLTYVEDTFPRTSWDQFKREYKRCASKYIEDDTDTHCVKSERFTTCLEDVTQVICESPPGAGNAPPPSQVVNMPPPPYPQGTPQLAPAGHAYYNTPPVAGPVNYYVNNQKHYYQPPPPPPPRASPPPCFGILGICLG